MCGGTFSILLAIGIFVYFVIEVTSVFNKTDYTITNSIIKRNLSEDNRVVTLTNDNFLVSIYPQF